MSVRSLTVALLTVIVLISVIELSTWVLRHTRPMATPSATVSDVETPMPQAPEVDAPAPTPAPALTW